MTLKAFKINMKRTFTRKPPDKPGSPSHFEDADMLSFSSGAGLERPDGSMINIDLNSSINLECVDTGK